MYACPDMIRGYSWLSCRWFKSNKITAINLRTSGFPASRASVVLSPSDGMNQGRYNALHVHVPGKFYIKYYKYQWQTKKTKLVFMWFGPESMPQSFNLQYHTVSVQIRMGFVCDKLVTKTLNHVSPHQTAPSTAWWHWCFLLLPTLTLLQNLIEKKGLYIR